jgi:hypothetical protein
MTTHKLAGRPASLAAGITAKVDRSLTLDMVQEVGAGHDHVCKTKVKRPIGMTGKRLKNNIRWSSNAWLRLP